MHLYDDPADLRPDRARALHGARRRRLRRRYVAAARRIGAARRQRIREHAHHSMAPVWEANHVWLIFVLTVIWTAYPVAFGSIASTLSIPLFIAAIGIVLRGASYALRAGAASPRELRRDRHRVLALLDPHAVRARRRDRCDRRAPRAGRQRRRRPPLELDRSDLDPDRRARRGERGLSRRRLPRRRRRTPGRVRRWSGVPRPRARRGPARGRGRRRPGCSCCTTTRAPLPRAARRRRVAARSSSRPLAGVATLALVWSRRFELARYTAALAVAAIDRRLGAGAAAGAASRTHVRRPPRRHDTLVTVIVAVIVGGAILFPSLGAAVQAGAGRPTGPRTLPPGLRSDTDGRGGARRLPGGVARQARRRRAGGGLWLSHRRRRRLGARHRGPVPARLRDSGLSSRGPRKLGDRGRSAGSLAGHSTVSTR